MDAVTRTPVAVNEPIRSYAPGTAERDSLRSRLAAARARIDALLERLPAETAETTGKGRAP